MTKKDWIIPKILLSLKFSGVGDKFAQKNHGYEP